jgi:prolyl-tRNA editing enzyme YbaK/EbsC (Cys-tRNA(Pro) deacylase)
MNPARPGTRLHWRPAQASPELIATPVRAALERWSGNSQPEVAEIDPALADTAEFCLTYGVALAESANCVIVSGKREGQLRYAACMVLATTRADVNGIVRRLLDVRKASFAQMADAVSLTTMEYGGITPIGLPARWPILVSDDVARSDSVVIGSGLRGSKLRLPGRRLLELPNAQLVEGLGRPVELGRPAG